MTLSNRRMRFAFWISKATDTHSEYVICIAFPLQQWLHAAPGCYVIRTLSCFFTAPCRPTSNRSTHFQIHIMETGKKDYFFPIDIWMGFSHFRVFTFTTCINMQIFTTNKQFHFPGISTMLPSHIHIACCCKIFFKYTYYLKNKRPTWCHLLFYFTSYVLNMFRTLICPSSGSLRLCCWITT